ncbi:hypothetical protein KJ855_02510 [Patescibacteria group bacterium]|nr:hypothetical protein [Patescibacteria group bacterium]
MCERINNAHKENRDKLPSPGKVKIILSSYIAENKLSILIRKNAMDSFHRHNETREFDEKTHYINLEEDNPKFPSLKNNDDILLIIINEQPSKCPEQIGRFEKRYYNKITDQTKISPTIYWANIYQTNLIDRPIVDIKIPYRYQFGTK